MVRSRAVIALCLLGAVAFMVGLGWGATTREANRFDKACEGHGEAQFIVAIYKDPNLHVYCEDDGYHVKVPK